MKSMHSLKQVDLKINFRFSTSVADVRVNAVLLAVIQVQKDM
jgi:hypothetical protein